MNGQLVMIFDKDNNFICFAEEEENEDKVD